MTDRPTCLDVTRLVSRVGAGPHTGIDRVEYAYLRELLARGGPLFGLSRTATGFVLLTREGLAAVKARIDGASPWGAADIEARFSRRLSPDRRRAESDLRALAVARSWRGGLAPMFARALPAGTLYLNTGHANLSDDVFDAVRNVSQGAAAVLVHDTIPIRRPEFQRPGTAERFEEKLAAVARGADVVLCTSRTEGRHVERELRRLGGGPEVVVVPPGIDVPAPERTDDPLPRAPYFVVLGTIEPRKNLSIVIDVWNALADDATEGLVPGLCIVGRRGWESEETLARLDALKARCPEVVEYSDLGDGPKAALLADARALLFPSFDEGYGFPPFEALALGTPAVCAPLDVFRETLGDVPVYAAADDMYQWLKIVRIIADVEHSEGADIVRRAKGLELPTWKDHVNHVLTTIP